MLINHAIQTVYLTKPAFHSELCEELGNDIVLIEDMILNSAVESTSSHYGSTAKFRMILSPHPEIEACFAQDCWLEPHMIKFDSISEAANQLRQAGKYWYLHPMTHVRRSRLIEAQLRPCPSLSRDFPIQTPLPPIGCFSLLDKNTLIYSTKRFKKWPGGVCFFNEDKINPPNRAYLKLWEALTLLERMPKPGETALDLGASPGGWTYVMQSLGASVTAVDKAPLTPSIAARPHVQFLQQSAFALDPNKISEPYDWVLSDIACYPDRAYSLIMKWINSGKAKQLIFTIKLQGEIEWSMLTCFQEIPNARLLHLFYNKHEVTFFYPFLK